MKKIIKKIGALALLTLMGFIIFSAFTNPEEDIIGTWVLENDANSKWVFTDNNCYWYYQNNLEGTFTYIIEDLSNSSNSTFLCGQEVKTGGTEDFYLKLTNQDNDNYCYEIFGLKDEKLSINFLGQAKIQVFNKQ